MSFFRQPIPHLTDALVFPAPKEAGPEGLVAVGGDLKVERLMLAYESGIFPWFDNDSLILWWSPDPRMVLFPEKLKISKSLRRTISKDCFQITKNKAFEAVVTHCAEARRKGQEGTWITREMKKAYVELHHMGKAVSFEAWQNDQLVGGLYGVDLGKVFCGESMFAKVSDASKVAFVTMVEALASEGYKLIDCQVYTQHLESLGGEEIPRIVFLEILKNNLI